MRSRNRSRALGSIAYWADDDWTRVTGRSRPKLKAIERRRVRRAERRMWQADAATA